MVLSYLIWKGRAIVICKMYASISNAYLAPKGVMEFEQSNNNTLILMSCQKKTRVIAEGILLDMEDCSSFIGSSFQIENISEGINSLQAIKFSLSSKNIDHLLHPIHFINQQDSFIVSNIFRILPLNPSNFEEVEQLLSILIKEIVFRFPITPRKEDRTAELGRMGSRLLIINRYLRRHYQEPITLDLLANLIGCNSVYLSNTYSKVFNISPIQSLQKIRMKKAKELLSNTEFSIKEICEKVGYVSISQFGTLFKKHFGITPSECRRINKTQNNR